MGGKKDPHYRVVVAERRGPRDGRFVESVGYYNPAMDPVRLNLDMERVDYWIGIGAQPSETVRSLIRKVKSQEEAPAKVLETAAKVEAETAAVVEVDAPEKS
jgi:small subunit ribosomal protein S16